MHIWHYLRRGYKWSFNLKGSKILSTNCKNTLSNLQKLKNRRIWFFSTNLKWKRFQIKYDTLWTSKFSFYKLSLIWKFKIKYLDNYLCIKKIKDHCHCDGYQLSKYLMDYLINILINIRILIILFKSSIIKIFIEI